MLRIFADELIAFFPDEGFLAFEGYGMIPADQLPCMVTAWRSKEDWKRYGGTIDGELFQLRITASYKKDVQEPKEARADRPPHGCDDPIECGCGIQFFPRDLILYRFDVVSCSDKTGHDFRYCIDDRFKSPSQLIERYMALAELPENQWESYDTCEADREFFVGYDEIKQRNKNMYQNKFDQLAVKRRPRSYDSFLALLNEWNTRFRHVPNDKMAHLTHLLSFFEFIKTNLPVLQAWCDTYQQEITLEEKLQGWLTYGLQTQRIPLDYFKKHWKLFFRLGNDSADIATLNGRSYDISYPHYLVLIKRMKKERDFSQCTSDEIHNKHKGIACSNPLDCVLCDEQQTLWRASVYERYRAMNNVFINRTCGIHFLEAWMSEVIRMRDKEKASIHYVWPPMAVYQTPRFYGRNENLPYSQKDYIRDSLSVRSNLYDPYEDKPRDIIEHLGDFLQTMTAYELPDSAFVDGPNRWNEVYLFLSSFVSYAPVLLPVDEACCRERVQRWSRRLAHSAAYKDE